MKKFDKIIGKLSLVAVLLFALFVLMSGDAFASGTTAGTQSHYGACREKGSIFAVMRCMIAYTLYDIRYIVYIVGALGLITFAYGAIFGKISFKHLANICFSLFLVSMLSPFVRYFSGDENALPELTYNLYLSPDYEESDDYSAIDSQSAIATNGLLQKSSSNDTSDIDVDGLIASTGLRPKSSENTGEVGSPEEKTMSSWDKIKKTISTVKTETQKAVNTASTMYTAAKNVKSAVSNSVNAISNIHDVQSALAAGQIILDNAGGVSTNVLMAAGAVGAYTDPKVMGQYNDMIGATEGGIATNRAQISDNNKYIESLGVDITNLETARNRIQASGGDTSALDAQIAALNKTRNETMEENKNLTSEISELQAKAETLKKERDASTAVAKTANAMSGVNTVIKEGSDVAADVSQTAGAVQGGINMGNAIMNGEGLW